jgi:hypothetical protein
MHGETLKTQILCLAEFNFCEEVKFCVNYNMKYFGKAIIFWAKMVLIVADVVAIRNI